MKEEIRTILPEPSTKWVGNVGGDPHNPFPLRIKCARLPENVGLAYRLGCIFTGIIIAGIAYFLML